MTMKKDTNLVTEEQRTRLLNALQTLDGQNKSRHMSIINHGYFMHDETYELIMRILLVVGLAIRRLHSLENHLAQNRTKNWDRLIECYGNDNLVAHLILVKIRDGESIDAVLLAAYNNYMRGLQEQIIEIYGMPDDIDHTHHPAHRFLVRPLDYNVVQGDSEHTRTDWINMLNEKSRRFLES